MVGNGKMKNRNYGLNGSHEQPHIDLTNLNGLKMPDMAANITYDRDPRRKWQTSLGIPRGRKSEKWEKSRSSK